MRLVIAVVLNALYSHSLCILWLWLWLWFSGFGCDLTLSGAHVVCDEVPLGMCSGAGPPALPEGQVNELAIVYVVLVFS